MNPIELFESEFTSDHPYESLQDDLVHNDDRMLEDLVAMRKRKGLSQDTVAGRMNRSKTAVSNFERLGADPHLSTIRRYAAAIGAEIHTRVLDFDDRIEIFSDADDEGPLTVIFETTSRRTEIEVSDAVIGPWVSA